MFGLSYLSLSIGICFVRVFKRTYKTVYEYYYKLFLIAYKNNLYHIQKQFNIILSLAIKIAYASLYISAYYDKHMCYRLQISCLSKQALTN